LFHNLDDRIAAGWSDDLSLLASPKTVYISMTLQFNKKIVSCRGIHILNFHPSVSILQLTKSIEVFWERLFGLNQDCRPNEILFKSSEGSQAQPWTCSAKILIFIQKQVMQIKSILQISIKQVADFTGKNSILYAIVWQQILTSPRTRWSKDSFANLQNHRKEHERSSRLLLQD
jgi:hypothetical protein